MNKKLQLTIRAHAGYAATEVSNGMTVGRLKEMLESFDDDMEIVTHDENNSLGAAFGSIEWIDEAEETEETEEY